MLTFSLLRMPHSLISLMVKSSLRLQYCQFGAAIGTYRWAGTELSTNVKTLEGKAAGEGGGVFVGDSIEGAPE